MAQPKSVLFACQLNSVRSPIASALFARLFGKAIRTGSAGVQEGDLDPFAVAVMDEAGIDISRHKPMTFEQVEDLEGLDYDLIVTLSPGAHHRALEIVRGTDTQVEYWPMPDATGVEGNREQRLDAYRAVRDQLLAKIRERFGGDMGGNE
jgi:protein-tyrosine-phosphatase